ncbi:hypothetical protein GBA52_023215 [Prunus armeniaca]|nr:hypothetical protein GBA52_023215 [Prunus armeniaca]
MVNTFTLHQHRLSRKSLKSVQLQMPLPISSICFCPSSMGTHISPRNKTATAAALANKYGADITVVVIDEKEKESLPQHETQLSTIRWHLSEGGFKEYKLLERLGEGNKPTAIIGEVADDLNLDLVVISMEAIHSKHVDANLLAEFIPCPVILLPL